MNRRAFFCSLLGLAAVAALPAGKAQAAQPAIDPVLDPMDQNAADRPAADAADAQYYGGPRRVVRRRVVTRRVVYRRRPVVYRRVVYRRPVRVRRVYY